MGVEPENTLRSFVARRAGRPRRDRTRPASEQGRRARRHARRRRGPHDRRHRADRRARPSPSCARWTPGRASGSRSSRRCWTPSRAPLQAEIKDVAAARALAEVMRRRDLAARVEVLVVPRRGARRDRPAGAGGPHRAGRQPLRHRRGGPGQGGRARRRSALNIRRLTLEVVEQAHAEADLKVIGWVVNTQDHLRLVRALGLDGATTDYPEIKRAGRFTALTAPGRAGVSTQRLDQQLEPRSSRCGMPKRSSPYGNGAQLSRTAVAAPLVPGDQVLAHRDHGHVHLVAPQLSRAVRSASAMIDLAEARRPGGRDGPRTSRSRRASPRCSSWQQATISPSRSTTSSRLSGRLDDLRHALRVGPLPLEDVRLGGPAGPAGVPAVRRLDERHERAIGVAAGASRKVELTGGGGGAVSMAGFSDLCCGAGGPCAGRGPAETPVRRWATGSGTGCGAPVRRNVSAGPCATVPRPEGRHAVDAARMSLTRAALSP